MDYPFILEAFNKLFSKPSCNNYPFVPSEAAPGYRGRIVFHPEKCINCGMCERVCAGSAISTVTEPVEDGMRVTRTFYLGSCTFCSTCVDFCHEKAIELTTNYHMIATKEEDLIVSGTFIKKKPQKKSPPLKPEAVSEGKAEQVKAEQPDLKATVAADCSKNDIQTETAEKETARREIPQSPEENAVNAVKSVFQPRDDGKPASDPSKCIYCSLCAKKCPMGAIEVDRTSKTWKLDEDQCIGCGTCAEACPKKCIAI